MLRVLPLIYLELQDDFYFVRSSDEREADCEDRAERDSRSGCDGGLQFLYV